MPADSATPTSSAAPGPPSGSFAPSILDLMGEASGKPGDVATVLIAGVTVGVLDAVLNPIGALTALQSSGAAAAGALGLKRAWEARRRQKQEKREQQQREEKQRADSKKEVVRANEILRYLRASVGLPQHKQAADRLEKEIEYFDKGISDDNDLKSEADRAMSVVRAIPLPSRPMPSDAPVAEAHGRRTL